jgi:hypothetical protein
MWQFQTTGQTQYFQMHLLALRFVLLVGDDRDFLKEGVKTSLTAPTPLFISPTFFPSAHL